MHQNQHLLHPTVDINGHWSQMIRTNMLYLGLKPLNLNLHQFYIFQKHKKFSTRKYIRSTIFQKLCHSGNVIHKNTISDGSLRKEGQKRQKKFFTKSQYTMANLCQEISSWFRIQQRTENHPDAAFLGFWNFSNHRISGKRPWSLTTYGLPLP